MEELKKVIRAELRQLIFENEDSNFFTRHPVFSNPEKAAEYAMQWQEKATELNKFYWTVEAIVTSQLASQDKVNRISELLPNYGWV